MYTAILLAALATEPTLQPMPGCHSTPGRSTTVERSMVLVPQAPKMMMVERRTTTTVREAGGCSGSGAGCSGSGRMGLFGRMRSRGVLRGGCS